MSRSSIRWGNILAAKVFGNEIFLEGGGTGKISVMGRAREVEL